MERGAGSGEWGVGSGGGGELFRTFEGEAEGEDHFALLLEFRKQWSDLGFLKIAFSDKQHEHVCNFVDRTAGEFEKVGDVQDAHADAEEVVGGGWDGGEHGLLAWSGEHGAGSQRDRHR